jgi:hypothetical protein
VALKLYKVTVNGYETILQLDEEDVKARGLVESDLWQPEAPAVEPDAAADAAAAEAAEKAAAAPANKSRAAAANK